MSTNRYVRTKHTHTHTQPCRNWLQLVVRWSLSFLHQFKSERLIIRRACLMTTGLTRSDSETLWYSGRNPPHLHCALNIKQFFYLLSILNSLNMCWISMWLGQQRFILPFCLEDYIQDVMFVCEPPPDVGSSVHFVWCNFNYVFDAIKGVVMQWLTFLIDSCPSATHCRGFSSCSWVWEPVIKQQGLSSVSANSDSFFLKTIKKSVDLVGEALTGGVVQAFFFQ